MARASSRTGSLLIIAALAAVIFASPARAQRAATPAPRAAASQPTVQKVSMPGVDDVLKAVNKATAAGNDGEREWATPIKMAVVFAVLALLPSLLVMMTSFTRIIIVLGFIRRALTTQNLPPTIALVGLGLFLTLFTMSPTFSKINQQALQPYLADKMTLNEACGRGNDLLKEFMLRQTRRGDLQMFMDMGRLQQAKSAADLPSYVVIPAFAVSEFRTAFEMGCLLFIPFLLVDLIVSGVLLSAGMMMLPPSIISLPFKIILFVLIDGWALLSRTLVQSFN